MVCEFEAGVGVGIHFGVGWKFASGGFEKPMKCDGAFKNQRPQFIMALKATIISSIVNPASPW